MSVPPGSLPHSLNPSPLPPSPPPPPRSRSSLSLTARVYDNVDRDEDDEISISELDYALKAVNYNLISDAEMNYVHSVSRYIHTHTQMHTHKCTHTHTQLTLSSRPLSSGLGTNRTVQAQLPLVLADCSPLGKSCGTGVSKTSDIIVATVSLAWGQRSN